MLTPKKTIPSLAVTMLALTGCGGDAATNGTGGSGATGGAGGNGGGGLANALSTFCMKVAGCYENYTVEECTNYYDTVFPPNLDSNCEAAIISYFNCGTALSCEELMMYSNSCDDEFDAITAACANIMQ